MRSLMQGVGSVKRYGKEVSEKRLKGDAGFANKANLPHRGEREAPLPLPDPPPCDSGRREGRRREGGWGGGGNTGRREGRDRGSEKERQ